MERVIGRRMIEAFELGNEPELYANRYFYKLNGVDVFGRPSSWDFGSYLHDYTRMAAAMGHVRISQSGSRRVFVDLQSAAVHACRAARRSHHSPIPAAIVQCAPGIVQLPDDPHLLGSTASAGLADALEPYVAMAHAHHVPFRNAEMNSVSCGSDNSVAETFASALWVTDTLFNLVHAGVDGVNVRTFNRADPLRQRARPRDAAGLRRSRYGVGCSRAGARGIATAPSVRAQRHEQSESLGNQGSGRTGSGRAHQ